MRTHLADPAIAVIPGTMRKSQPVTHYCNPRTGLNVMKDANGDFVSGWRLSDKQLRELLTTATVPWSPGGP
ncbi:MAG: colicin D domain-containing protein [Reyranellaceae bacterium]